MSKVRILLRGERIADLDGVVNQIKELGKTLGMRVRGPVNLPVRRLNISTRRTPCGDGSDTYEHWEKRIHKRLVDVEGDEKIIRQILRVKVPNEILVKIFLE